MTEIEKAHIMRRRLAGMINVIGTSDRAQIANSMHAMIGKAEKLEAVEAEFAAFKQEVSDAAKRYIDYYRQEGWLGFDNYIIPDSDPLVGIFREVDNGEDWDNEREYATKFRQALAARGLKIVEQDQ